MPDDLKPVLARQMEVYAGFMEHTDHHVGRLIDALEDLDILDDTLVYVIIGDNGASAEGTPQGTFNELLVLNGAAAMETTEFMASRIDQFGTPEAYNHYAVGWAHAMDTPYQWTKQVASHWGGTRNGTIVHWPNGIKAKGEIRDQFHHVIDVAPTVLEAAGIPAPTFVNGIQQAPLEGVSMVYAFDDAKAADRHTTQYFEMFVNRGIYHQGWTAVTRHSHAVGRWRRCRPTTTTSGSSTRPTTGPRRTTSSKEQPDKLAHLQRLFLIEATKYNVLPLDDRRVERFNPDLAGRPAAHPRQPAGPVRRHGPADRELDRRAQEQVARGHGPDRGPDGRRDGTDRRPGRRVRRLEPLPQGQPAGVLLQPVRAAALQGRRRRRRSRPASTRSGSSSRTTAAASPRAAPPRSSSTAARSARAGSTATVPMLFSADETTDVGSDTGTPVTRRPGR